MTVSYTHLLLGFGIVCHSCNYLVTHIDMFLVHYRIVDVYKRQERDSEGKIHISWGSQRIMN